MNNIYLLGFMATGKTSVGRKLAKMKKWRFLDLDDLIELRQRMTISDIFAKKGEAYFRSVEKNILREVSKEKRFVIACGGGIVLNKENIAVMKQTGKLICLEASVEAILKRARGSSARPLLNVDDQKERIVSLLAFRKPFYRQVDHTIDTSKLSEDQVAKKIAALLKRKGRSKKK